MVLQDEILLRLLSVKRLQTIGQLAIGVNAPWRDAAKAVTILCNRGLVFEADEQGGVDAVPLYALTSGGDMTARGLRSAQRMMESTDDNHEA